MLPHAIGQFGELIICSTHFNKYQAEQYVPKFNLGLESENYPQKRRSWDPSDAKSWMAVFDDEFGAGNGSSSSRTKPSERLSRQKEESYSRYTSRRSQQESTGSPRRSQETIGASSSSRQFGQASPWARVQQMLDSPAASATPAIERSPQPQSDESPTNITIRRRRDQLDLSDSDDDLNQRVNSIRRDYERRQRENNQVQI